MSGIEIEEAEKYMCAFRSNDNHNKGYGRINFPQLCSGMASIFNRDNLKSELTIVPRFFDQCILSGLIYGSNG